MRKAFTDGGTLNITDRILGTWGGIRSSAAENGKCVVCCRITQEKLHKMR
jgi:hypothetical protein